MTRFGQATFTAAAAALCVLGVLAALGHAGDDSIRPFRVSVPEEELTDLRRRVAATRWPDRETVDDRSQGAQLARIQELVRYWGTEYDWRKAEAKLNALPQFVTKIDGLDIHFIHVRSRHPNALPLIMTHGWPGSVFELLKIIGPLTDPTAHGGRAGGRLRRRSALHAWLRLLGEAEAHGLGTGPDGARVGRADEAPGIPALRVTGRRLGLGRRQTRWRFRRRRDCSAFTSTCRPPCRQKVAKALAAGGPPPAGLSADEKVAYEGMDALYKKGSGYAGMMVTRPQTLGYSLADSPVGLAAWFYDKFADWTYSGGEPERSLTRDEMLDDITLYWLTNTGTSGARLYWENNANNFTRSTSRFPAAVTVFPGEIYQAPKSWTERAYHKLIYFNQVDKGGHFAAWEEPELFSEELRAAFRSLR